MLSGLIALFRCLGSYSKLYGDIVSSVRPSAIVVLGLSDFN